MGGVGGSPRGGRVALLAGSADGIGRGRKDGGPGLTASPTAYVEAAVVGAGFLLTVFTLVGVGGSRAGQTQAPGPQSWKGSLNEDAVTVSSIVSGGEGGAGKSGLKEEIDAGASLCGLICRDGRAVCDWGTSISATLGLHLSVSFSFNFNEKCECRHTTLQCEVLRLPGSRHHQDAKHKQR